MRELSPAIRICLSPSPRGLNGYPRPVGPTIASAGLDANPRGCQDHTLLPYATAPVVSRAVLIAHGPFANPPCDHLRARRSRVHRIPCPRFVTIMIRPSERAGMGGNMRVIWGRSQEEFLIFTEYLITRHGRTADGARRCRMRAWADFARRSLWHDRQLPGRLAAGSSSSTTSVRRKSRRDLEDRRFRKIQIDRRCGLTDLDRDRRPATISRSSQGPISTASTAIPRFEQRRWRTLAGFRSGTAAAWSARPSRSYLSATITATNEGQAMLMTRNASRRRNQAKCLHRGIHEADRPDARRAG